MIHKFAKTNALPDFDPEPAPSSPAATCPIPHEKDLDVISFRGPDGTKDYLQRRAGELGITKSEFVMSLVDRDRNEQAVASKSCTPLETAVAELSREVHLALADGRVDSHERARISRPAAWIMAYLWPRRIA